MSNTKSNREVDELHFRVAVNLHYGAFNLLNQSVDQLTYLDLISKSEIDRYHKFVQFYQNLLYRGTKKIYPETVKTPENGIQS